MEENSNISTAFVGFPGASCQFCPVASTHRFIVPENDEGLRLDQAISKNVQEVSRTFARRILAEGGVFVDRKRVKVAGRKVRSGQCVEVHGLPSVQTQSSSTPVRVPLLSTTDQFVVVDKPSGVFSAPTPQSDRNDCLAFVAATLEEAGFADTSLYLVHRLDRPTSGLMILARTRETAAHLTAQLVSRSMSRKYLAILSGPMEQQTTVREPIGGKMAETQFTVLQTKRDATLVEAALLSGRTHQVRIHAAHLGSPIAGDSKYGRWEQRKLPRRPPRLCLHAGLLRFEDPAGGSPKQFSSPLPAEIANWFAALPDCD